MAQGRLRRLVTRRRVKWVGTVAVFIVAVVYVMSIWMAAGIGRSDEKGAVWLYVEHGALCVLSSNGDPRSYGNPGGPKTEGRFDFGFFASDEVWAFQWINWKSIQSPDFGGMVSVFIPLWIPFALFAIPTAWLWYTDRRAKPWQCAKCRYDLRGLDSGVCPECGRAHAKPGLKTGVQ